MFAKCWKNLKLGTNKLKLDFKLLPKFLFSKQQYPTRNRPVKSTPIWPKMKCNYLIPSRQLNLSHANKYTCHGVMLSNDTQITRILNFHPYLRGTVDFFIKFMTKNAVFCCLAQQERVKHIIWNQHISVNVHIAQILIKTIILKKRN